MNNSIDQQVIDFTANYVSMPSSRIHNYTVLADIGIVTQQETITYVMELEESFGLAYDPGDESGIITVGDATELITKKLGVGEPINTD